MGENYWIIFFIFFGALGTTMPIFLCVFLSGLFGMLIFSPLPGPVIHEMMMQSLFKSLDKFPLIVVLFFILCGNIMTAGSIVQKLVRSATAIVDWIPGGLGMAGVIACGLFGAISGSAMATVVAIGGFMIPALLEQGYEESYSVGVMTASPVLGVVIPPSISMILYALISNVSLEGLFLTGFVPGIMIMLGFCLYTYFISRRRFVKKRSIGQGEMWAIFRESVWSLCLPVIIFGGIYSGVFTANEAAVVACVYAFIVEIFVHRDMKLRDVKSVVVNSAITSGSILIIVAGVTCLGRFLTMESIPPKITDLIVQHIQSPWMFLLAVNAFLFVIGMFMDIISATLILGPILLPMLGIFNVDPMHFGLLMTVNLGIGYCTPPLGGCLYVTSVVANKNILYISRVVLPFLLIMILLLIVMNCMPGVVLWLPRLFGYL